MFFFQVGSGKSSLLSSLTGDMCKTTPSGFVNVAGKVAYVPQQAWIQNESLQYNITFGKAFRRAPYDRILDVCALKPDLDILPDNL